MMRILLGLVIAVVFFSMVTTSPLSAQSQIAIIEVKPGDTVWQIAAEHSTVRQDVREVVATIRMLNQLDHNGRIHPGQSLKVPQKM